MNGEWPENLQALCRLCLKSITVERNSRDGSATTRDRMDDQMLPFSNSLLLPSWGKLFMDLTSFDITKEIDEFPKSLCSACSDRLMEYDKLRKKALKSTMRLHRMWNGKEANEVSSPVYLARVKREDNAGEEFVIHEVPAASSAEDNDEMFLPDVVTTSSISVKSEPNEEISNDHLLSSSFNEDIVINGDTIYSCLYSTDDTHNPYSLEINSSAHLQETNASDQTLLNCSICFKPFFGSALLKKHMREAHKRNKSIHQCTACPNSFRDSKQLTSHVRSKHRSKTTLTCTICWRVCQTEELYRKHMTYHSVPCPQCAKIFSSKSTLNRHIRVVHEGDKRYGCSYCSLRFGTLSSRISHERQHTSDLPYRCEKCRKAFAQEKTLLLHMRSHES